MKENLGGRGNLLRLHRSGVASENIWYPLLSSFQSHRRIICPDLRGMGRSHALDFEDWPISVGLVANDVSRLCSDLCI